MGDAAQECLPAGAEKVIEWFGRWPSFHDAEIVSLQLSRSASSLLRVYPYFPEKPATVHFILENVTDIDLTGFSSQNVIFGLSLEASASERGDAVYRLVLSPCFGIGGRMEAKSVRVELVPGKSPDGVSLW